MLVKNAREAGKQLAKIRKEAGLTQAVMAERTEMAERSYAAIERGGSRMRLDTLLRICETLRITPDAFLTLPDEPYNYPSAEALSDAIQQLPVREQSAATTMLDAIYKVLDTYSLTPPSKE